MTSKNQERTGRVMVVDDDPINHQAIRVLLAKENYQVEHLTDGNELLIRARAEPPDLILLDLMMPKVSGYEVCTRLREDNALSEVPVIVITSLDDSESRIRAIECGADEFITKPFDPRELRTRIRTIIRLNRYRHLLNERNKFDSLTELSPDGLLIVGIDGRIKMTNPAAVRMFKEHSKEHLLGRKIRELVATSRQAGFLALLSPCFEAEPSSVTIETEFQDADGKLFPVEITAGHFPLDEQPGAQLSIRDVTDKKLTEENYLRAQRVQTLGALAGGIAHDLNNVLAPILGAAHLLKMDLEEAKRNKLIDSVEFSAKRGAAIIAQLMTFARGVNNENASVDVGLLIKEVVKMLRATVPKSIELRYKVDLNSRLVLGSPTQLHQLLMNLGVNARDAMPEGGSLRFTAQSVHLTKTDIADHPEVSPGEFVQIIVSDTGTGMDKETREKIFQPFFTTKEKGKGTGLGLMTVLSIVKQTGGVIRVYSKLGKGTEFQVFLPATVREDNIETEDDSEAPPSGNGETILLADDEPAFREITKATLERYGYRVLTADDGPEAVSVFADNRGDVDLALLDFMMPYMDGRTTGRVIRKLRDGIPIVYVTGKVDHDDADNDGDRGDTPVLFKPFSQKRLLLALKNSLESAGGTRAEPAAPK